MQEIFETAPKVLGREWPSKLASANADKILKSSERNTDGLPSMLLDWQAGRPMELEVILGNPVRLPSRTLEASH
jgi:ketopantoate reductase